MAETVLMGQFGYTISTLSYRSPICLSDDDATALAGFCPESYLRTVSEFAKQSVGLQPGLTPDTDSLMNRREQVSTV